MPNKTFVSREARKKAFESIRKIRSERIPSGFNPHYSIKPTTVQDINVSSKTGPKMKTQQWERTSGGRG